jgi:hypothetical protein
VENAPKTVDGWLVVAPAIDASFEVQLYREFRDWLTDGQALSIEEFDEDGMLLRDDFLDNKGGTVMEALKQVIIIRDKHK